MLKIFRALSLLVSALALVAVTGTTDGSINQAAYTFTCLLVLVISAGAWSILDRKIRRKEIAHEKHNSS